MISSAIWEIVFHYPGRKIKLNLKRKNLYIHKFLLYLSNALMFKPISVADIGCSTNHIKTFDIIMNAKFVFLNFV